MHIKLLVIHFFLLASSFLICLYGNLKLKENQKTLSRGQMGILFRACFSVCGVDAAAGCVSLQLDG